jgi:hypothetical protein
MPDAIFTNVDDLRAFTLAGKAFLTLQSLRTQQHFTYKVIKSKWQGKPLAYFVFVLVSEGQYSYLGMITSNNMLTTTSRSNFATDNPRFVAFKYFLETSIRGNTIPRSLVVRHEGRCGKCSLPLTHPTSIDRGIGPECQKKLTCQ